MREILFRGKRPDNGEWVEGWYEMYPFGRWPVKTSIIPSEGAKAGHYEHVEVDSSTVGQYTGLNDKNGKRIFEGDILKWDSREWGCDHLEIANWDYELFDMRKNDWEEWCEIIGNIHDNPELLEK